MLICKSHLGLMNYNIKNPDELTHVGVMYELTRIEIEYRLSGIYNAHRLAIFRYNIVSMWFCFVIINVFNVSMNSTMFLEKNNF